MVVASAVCTNTTINHGYRYPINKSVLAERAGLPQSYYVCTYKLHKLHNNRREITYNNNGGVYGEGWSFTVSADRLDVLELYNNQPSRQPQMNYTTIYHRDIPR